MRTNPCPGQDSPFHAAYVDYLHSKSFDIWNSMVSVLLFNVFMAGWRAAGGEVRKDEAPEILPSFRRPRGDSPRKEKQT